MPICKALHIFFGIAALLSGWLLQFLLLILGVYAFNYLMYRSMLYDTTLQYLLRYLALPLCTIMPSIIVILASRYLSRTTSRKMISLQWIQPSLAIAVLFSLLGGAANIALFQLILLAASGYVPLIFFSGRNKNRLADT